MNRHAEGGRAKAGGEGAMLVTAGNQAADHRDLALQPAGRKQSDRLGWIGGDVGRLATGAAAPLNRKWPSGDGHIQGCRDGGGKAWLAGEGMLRHMLTDRVVEAVAREVGVAGAHAVEVAGEEAALSGRHGSVGCDRNYHDGNITAE